MSAPEEMVTLRLFAAARDAAGSSVLQVSPGSCQEVLCAAAAGRSERFTRVLEVSSLICDGLRLDRASTDPVTAGSVIDVLPPFAGG